MYGEINDVELQWKFFFYCLHLSNKLFKNHFKSLLLYLTCDVFIFFQKGGSGRGLNPQISISKMYTSFLENCGSGYWCTSLCLCNHTCVFTFLFNLFSPFNKTSTKQKMDSFFFSSVLQRNIYQVLSRILFKVHLRCNM